MNGVASIGVSDVQSRIAAIRAQLGQLSAPDPNGSFALPGTAPATGTAGSPGAAGLGDTVPLGSAATAPPVQSAVRSVPSGTATGEAAVAEAKLAAVLPEAGKRWAGPIAQAATAHGLDPALLAALVRHESNFDPDVRSRAGAIGLGQLMPGTAAGLGVDPTDPIQNLDGAARYLKTQLDRFGSADLALAAYNAGPNRVAQAGGIPNITETRTYVDRVLTTWEQYR